MYQMIDKDKVLSLVKEKGPVIPNHLKKDLQADTIIIGAILSQLIAEGKLKVTRVKIGGSPNYYAPGSEAKLVELIKYLNEKDRRAAELLQEKKVLNASQQDPLVRVCLSNIKDYAKPIEVVVGGKTEIFYKWYLLTSQEAEDLIMKQVRPEKPAAKEEKKVEKQQHKEEESIFEESEKTKKEEIKKEQKPKAAEKETSIFKEEPKQKREELKKEEPKKEETRKEARKIEVQQVFSKPKEILDSEKNEFFQTVRKYLEHNDIAIVEYKIAKKAEIDLTISVPTMVGNQEYFCKAKNKKKINDGDLSSAYMQGQQTKLPIIFLSPGELNKKAKDMLKDLKGMIVKGI